MANKFEEKIKDDPYLLWLSKTRGLSENTVENYYKYYKHLKKIEITQENINAFLQSKKNNSVVRACIKCLLEFLYENKLLEEEIIMPPHKTGSKKKRIIRNFSQDQIKKVREYSYNKNFQEGVLFDLLYYGALRREEIVTVKVNSFDWSTFFEDHHKHCKLLVLGKGKKHREVLIHPDTISKIWDKYKEIKYIHDNMTFDYIISLLTSNNALLFKNIYKWKVWQIIKRNSLRSIGISIRPHELRHTRATELERNGAEIRTIQHYLGHSSPQITEIYLHTTQTQSLQKMMDIVND